MRLRQHYHAVRERHGYDPVDFDLGDVPAERLRRRFVAVDGRDAMTVALDRPTVVATGVGMTGPPHLGTVGQILNAVALQETGMDVQFVLADLEPYHGGRDLDAVRDRAERFRSFVLDLGFDPSQGTLRTQEEAGDVMHTAQLLARYYAPEEGVAAGNGNGGPDLEPTEWEAAVEEAYAAVDREQPGPTSDAAATHSTLLHLADFLHPLMKGDYEQVVVSLGVDEHELTLATRRFLRDAPVEGTVVGFHGRMVTGLGDAPKMGRSLPGSAVHLDMPPETIREYIEEAADRDGRNRPGESMVFQAMCVASRYDAAALDRLETACAADDDAWARARADFADYVLGLADQW